MANTDAINTCMVAVLSVTAQNKVIKYNDTKRMMPRMASTCFAFFMKTSCVMLHNICQIPLFYLSDMELSNVKKDLEKCVFFGIIGVHV